MMLAPELLLMLLAVLVSSLLGSPHCVGMCGPFALLVARPSPHSPGAGWLGLTFYHLGRAGTYTLLGLLAGWAGAWFNLAGSILGWQQLAARITGTGMILFGLLALVKLTRSGALHWGTPAVFARPLRWLYRATSALSPRWRALAVGSITGFLPCGWLYAFMLLAVGTSHPGQGALVMLAFWLGTIPALSAVGIGGGQLSRLPGRLVPYFAACLMIVGGLFTAAFRAEAALDGFSEPAVRAENYGQYLDELQNQPLPCCHPQEKTGQTSPEAEVPACCRQ